MLIFRMSVTVVLHANIVRMPIYSPATGEILSEYMFLFFQD